MSTKKILGTPTVTAARTFKRFVTMPSPHWEFCVEGDPHPDAGEQIMMGSVFAIVTFQGVADPGTYAMNGSGSVYKTAKITSTPSGAEPIQAKVKASYIYQRESNAENFTTGACP